MWGDRFSAIADALPVGVLLLDRSGNMVRANELGLTMLGLDQEAAGVENFAALLPSEPLRRAVGAPGTGTIDLRVPVGRKTYHAEVRNAPGGEDGEKLLVLRDVSDIAGVSMMRRNFVYDLLHMLRTPLTTIVSVLSMAASGRLDPNRVDTRELLGMGALQADRLTGLLARLKDLALVEMDLLKDEVDLRSVSPGEILTDLAGRFESELARKSQTLEMRLPAPDVRVLADREMLTRALEAVLSNAHLYSPDGAALRLAAEAGSGKVRIEIENPGPGILPEDLPTLFDRFKRGSAVAAVEGEGLGLYLARHILLAQNASIHLDSVPGETTTVEIVLNEKEPE